MNWFVGLRPRERLEDQEQAYLGLWHVDGIIGLSMKCEDFCTVG